MTIEADSNDVWSRGGSEAVDKLLEKSGLNERLHRIVKPCLKEASARLREGSFFIKKPREVEETIGKIEDGDFLLISDVYYTGSTVQNNCINISLAEVVKVSYFHTYIYIKQTPLMKMNERGEFMSLTDMYIDLMKRSGKENHISSFEPSVMAICKVGCDKFTSTYKDEQ